jgi:cellulose synthase operon protein C
MPAAHITPHTRRVETHPNKAWTRPLNGALKWPLACLAALVLVTLGGCFAVSEDKLAQTVQAQMAAGKFKEATLQLRSYLQDKPLSARAHFLLGQVLMRTGQWADGERELERALERGHPEREALPALMQAQLQLEKPEDVVKRWGDKSISDAPTAVRVNALLAQAYFQVGKLDPAQARLAQALAAEPDNVLAQRVKLRIAAQDPAQRKGALEQAAALAERSPKDAEVQVLLGDLLLATDHVAATQAYRRALAVDPAAVGAHTALIGSTLARGEVAQGRAFAADFAKALPSLSTAVYYEAAAAFAAQDYTFARDRLQALMRAGNASVRVGYLAGTTEARLGNLPQAENLLNKVVLTAPEELQPRLELAQIYMTRGNTQRALQILEPVITGDPSKLPGKVWSLVGQIYSNTGDFKKADAAFARARGTNPAVAAAAQTAQARAMLARRDIQGGLRNLRQVVDGEQTSLEAELAYTTALLSRGDADGALKALDTAAERRPNTALLDLMRSAAYSVKHDGANSRRALELAVRKDPRFMPAIEQLARQDAQAGKPELAAARYTELLKRDPRNVPAMLAMAELAKGQSNTLQAANTWLEKAVTTNPRDGKVWLEAMQHHLRRLNPAAAVSWGQRGLTAVPDNLELQYRLADVLLNTGDAEQASALTSKLVAAKPDVAQFRLLAAKALVAGKRVSAARSHVNKALELEPESPQVNGANVTLLFAEGKSDQAVLAARGFQKRNPKLPAAGWMLADVLERQNDKPSSQAAARQALEVAPAPDAALHYLSLLGRQGNTAGASQFASEWLTKYPNDSLFTGQAAVWFDTLGDRGKAGALYRRSLELAPNNPVALNNMAFYLLKSQDAKQALAMAQSAVKQAPEVASFHDTLARVQLALGNKQQALATQLKAIDLSPRSDDLRLELARIYLANNDKSKTRNELTRLSDLGAKFRRQDEVQKLLRELEG